MNRHQLKGISKLPSDTQQALIDQTASSFLYLSLPKISSKSPCHKGKDTQQNNSLGTQFHPKTKPPF